MNKQMKSVLLVGIIILLLSACGQFETSPVPDDLPELIVTPGSVEIIPTATLVNVPGTGKFSKYIGLDYPPLPVGISEDFSMIIQDSDDYGLWLVSDDAGRMLWLSTMTHRDSNGNAFWEVRDILDLSSLGTGLALMPDGCSLNGQPDHEILVAGKNGTISMAWRANTALNVFEVIPTNGIECHSDKGMTIE